MERDAYFDNARVLLIFLVVFGHMIQPFVAASHELNTFYMWIYTFHMPAFIFLAGFFAKGAGNWKYIVNLTKKLLIPYIIFQLLYTGYYFFIGKASWQTGLFYPHWSLWFLFSLFSWHILLYWFKKLPAVTGIVFYILLGVIVGYFGEVGHTFSLSRTFVLFPFFLTGYWLTNNHVLLLKRKSAKIGSVVIMLAVATTLYFIPDFNTGWLLGSKSYLDLGMPSFFGGVTRLSVYATATLMAMSVLAWVPRKHYRLTVLGTRTLYVYLLHGFFIQYFREVKLFEVNNVLDILGLAVVSAMIVLVLSSKPIRLIWEPFIEGRTSIIKRVFER